MTDQIKWKPVVGQMTDNEVQSLGIYPLKGRTYWSFWFFGRPLILQRESGVGWSTMAKSVQERALIGARLMGVV